jgi:hypothetical protein
MERRCEVKQPRKTLWAALLLGLLVPMASGTESPTDPYEILQKHFVALGGIEKLNAEQTCYFEGNIKLLDANLEGTIRQWDKPPLCQKQELDLGIFKQTDGRNEESSWVMDANGKVQIHRDEATLRRRSVTKLLEKREHLNPASPYFRITLEGREKVGERECHVIKISNTINEDILFQFIDVESFLLQKSINKEPDRESRTLYFDYRDVGGIKRSHRFEIEDLPVKQTFVIEVTQYESNIEVDPSLFDPPARDVQDFAFLKGESAEDISFEFIANHLFLPVTINGRERLWCLDTGAQMTAIDTRFALDLGLKPEGKIKGSGAGRTVDVSFVKLPEFSVPGLRFQSQQAISLEIGELFKRMYGMDVPGVLGYDFLSRLVTKIDYAKRKLSFFHPEKFFYQGKGHIIEAPLTEETFSVPVTVDGKFSGRWSLDLGAGGCSFHYPFAEENGLLALPGVERLGGGAGGDFREKEVRFQSIEFAGFTLSGPLIDVTLERTEGAFRRKELVGNLGNTVLRSFILYLDYKRQQIIVEKGEDYGREFPSDRSGLMVIRSEKGEVEIYFVSPGTPGETGGFRRGDIIRSIAGKEVSACGGILGVRQLLQQSPGTELSIMVAREGKRIMLPLKLKDLHRIN